MGAPILVSSVYPIETVDGLVSEEITRKPHFIGRAIDISSSRPKRVSTTLQRHSHAACDSKRGLCMSAPPRSCAATLWISPGLFYKWPFPVRAHLHSLESSNVLEHVSCGESRTRKDRPNRTPSEREREREKKRSEPNGIFNGRGGSPDMPLEAARPPAARFSAAPASTSGSILAVECSDSACRSETP